ncbi:MAG: hypothetical protein EPGJADBJ_02694 [Saprospiraceae bacterium]|nr:hypothetical protein [Saprospiraceae bacterium]
MTSKINVKPNMLTWAIARAGFDIDEFVRKNEKVQDWVTNKKEPTVKQLESFSKKVYLPFGYLFLPEPPIEKTPIPFFRTGRTATRDVSLNVRETVSLLQYRQDWLAEYLKNQEEAPLDFVGKFTLQNATEEIAQDMRRVLGLEKTWASNFPTWEGAKANFTRKIEEIGVVVVFNSIVENNSRRKITVEECRGFVLVDKYVPFLFVNNADSKSAQMFTLAHELAHVWLGKSAGFDARQLLPADDPVEKICDQVAAEFLVPADAFKSFWAEKPGIWYAARHFKVSQIVTARRALDLGFIDKSDYFKFYNNYIRENFNKKAKQKGGGDGYNNLKVRLGLPFVARLNIALKQGDISYKDAYRLSGLKGDTYQKFVEKFHL